MYKVMLVDDDPIVMVQMKKIIDWEELNCEIISEAANGKEAIDKIKNFLPDIVFTDISMPGLNGIDLINYICRNHPEIKVVALSAYDNFDYVRNSLTFGAVDYLLKYRLTREDMECVVRKIIDALAAGGKRRGEKSLEERRRECMDRVLYLSETKGGNFAGVEKSLGELGMGWMTKEFVMVFGSIDVYRINGEKAAAVDDTTAELIINETIKYFRQYYIVRIDKGLFLIIFSLDKRNFKEIEEGTEQLQSTMERFCGIQVSFLLGESMNDWRKIEEKRNYMYRYLMELYSQGRQNFILHQKEEAGTLSLQTEIYIREHYREKLSLARLARELAVSPSYLSRIFKKETGTTVVGFINQVRMEKAREKIEEQKLPLQEIAYEVGIQNYNYFYLLFKETYGVSPSEYGTQK